MSHTQVIVPLMVLATGVVVVAIVFYFTCFARRRRMLALMEWANNENLDFDPDGDGTEASLFPELNSLPPTAECAENVFTGLWRGYAIHAFDYHFSKQTDPTSSEGVLSVLIVEAPCPLKPLFLRPKQLKDSVAQVMGAVAIQFETAAFNRRFLVQAADRKWAYDVLQPRALELLLQAAPFNIEFSERYVAASRGGLFSLRAYAQALTLVVGLLPEFVRQEEYARGTT